MQVGDLVWMPQETLRPGETPSVGIVVETNHVLLSHPSRNRIGVWWTDSDCVDWEPIDWLEVINESR